MERVHASTILKVYMQRGKFYLFEWKERSTVKSVRNTYKLSD